MSAAEPPPLDARLLGNAVMELNIARHIHGLYPPEHQLVQASFERAFSSLAGLFDLRPEVTLGVAKDALVVDGRQLDPKNPVNRELALALSRMSIAFVSFAKGVSAGELHEFFRFLERDPGRAGGEALSRLLAEHHLHNIQVRLIDYREFAFAVDRTKKGGADPYLLERHLKNLVEGTPPAEGVRQLTEQFEPEALARLLSRTGASLAREASYDTVVSSYLRGGGGQGFTGHELERLTAFIENLSPELKRQFLASSVRAFTGDPGALRKALEEVSLDRVVELFGELQRSDGGIPDALSALLAQFARTGLELPGGGLNVDDVLISPEVAGLFRQEDGGDQSPLDYRAELRRLVDAPVDTAQAAAGQLLEREMTEDYVAYCHADALLAILEEPLPQLVALEDEEAYAQGFAANAARAVETGQYGQLLDLLHRVDDLERRGRHPAIVGAAREACTVPGFIAAVAESLCRHGRADRTAAAMVCGWYGVLVVRPLFDRLADEPRAHVRRLLLELLAGLGEPAVDEATMRLQDPRWHVRRNALYLLAESGARVEKQHLLGAARDPDPRVRLECARCLLRAGDPAGGGLLRSLLADPDPGVSAAAVAVAAVSGAAEVLPELIALAKKAAGVTGGRRRLRTIHALGLLGGEEAAQALRGLLSRRASIFSPGTKRYRAEIERALRRIERRLASAAGAPGGAGAQPAAGDARPAAPGAGGAEEP